jgi:hypothetical protein
VKFFYTQGNRGLGHPTARDKKAHDENAAQPNPKIDTEIVEKGRFRLEIEEKCHEME